MTKSYAYKARPLVYGPLTLRSLAIGPLLAMPILGYTVRLHKYFLGTKRREQLQRLSAKIWKRDKRDFSKFFKEKPPTSSPFPTKLTPQRAAQTSGRISSPDHVSIHVVNPYRAMKVGLKPYLTLDFPPKEVSFDIKSDFAAIKVLGANNPHYHYSGSEDTVTIEIDWYHFAAGTSDRTVLDKCRALEALSKADGVIRRPPVIYLHFGKDNSTFANHFFIVISASYKLNHFMDELTSEHRPKLRSSGQMLPLYATQTLVLKRVTTHSLTWKEIRT